MPDKNKVSEAVVKRLPRYYRYLADLLSNKIDRISSKDLANLMKVTASQIRQDLNCFGGFGQQGYGYNVASLYNEIGNILGLHKTLTTVLIGAGNLGHALAKYPSFKRRGFNLIGIFDNDPEKIGEKINDIEILPIEQLHLFLENNKTDIAILAIPFSEVAGIVNTLKEKNIKGIWNFSKMEIELPDEIALVNVHLSDSLMTLAYKIEEIEKSQN